MSVDLADLVTNLPAGTSPTALLPGSLIYLWAPGDPHWDGSRPLLLRLEKATVDTIIGRVLGPGGGRGAYPLTGMDRWRWELAAEPEVPVGPEGVEVVDRRSMDVDARREMLFGSCGQSVTLRMRNGDSVTGRIARLVMDGGECAWVHVAGPSDHRGVISHVLRFDDISGVTRTGAMA